MHGRAGLYRYFLEQDDEASAKIHLNRALDLYNDWGAASKVDQMLERYSFLNSEHVCSTSVGSNFLGRTRHEEKITVMNFCISESSSKLAP
jgi:hypothetical protein